MIFVWLFFLWFTSYTSVVQANTEIVNFGIGDSVPSIDLANNGWASLTHDKNQKQLEVLPAPLGSPLLSVCQNEKNCPHEVWLALDLDHPNWAGYDRFTLRVSWPGSSSADFRIDLYEALDARGEVLPKKRERFARVRLVDTGVFTPTVVGHTTSAPLTVPFEVDLEPLLLGLVPASLALTVLILVLVALAGFVVVPVVHKNLTAIAVQARKELLLLKKHD